MVSKKTYSVFKNFKSHLKPLISQPCEQPLAATLLFKKKPIQTSVPQLVMEDMEEKGKAVSGLLTEICKGLLQLPLHKTRGSEWEWKLNVTPGRLL